MTKVSGGPSEGNFYSHDNWNQVLRLDKEDPRYAKEMRIVEHLCKGNFYAFVNDLLQMNIAFPGGCHPRMSRRQWREYEKDVKNIFGNDVCIEPTIIKPYRV